MSILEDLLPTDFSDLRVEVRKVCSEFPDAYWEACDRELRFPEEFRQAFAEAGWLGVHVPVEYGGMGLGIHAAGAVLEEVAASGGAHNATSSVHSVMISLVPMIRHGSEEFKRKYLPSIVTGDIVVAFAVTEPEAGTDTTSISTRAERVDGGYEVFGSKRWIAGSTRADRFLLLTRTDPFDRARKASGMSLLFASAQDDKVTVTPINKVARNAVDASDVVFDGLSVAEGDRIGNEGSGFRHILDGLNAERIMFSFENIGFGRWALEHAISYAKERVIFGRPIGQNQAVQHPIAESFMRVMGAAVVAGEAARVFDGGDPNARTVGTLANTAKYLASTASFQAADRAMQVYGGNSYDRDHHVSRYWAETRMQRIAPVTEEMMLNYVAEHMLDLPRSY